MKRERLFDLVSLILTLCALIVTADLARRKYFPSPRPRDSSRPRLISDWKDLDRSGNRLGSSTAPVRVVEFADYECPFCRTLDATLSQLKKRYPGRIAVVYRQYPLPFHPYALPAAIGAECAAAQHRFPAYHALLFRLQDSLSEVNYDSIAVRAGIPDLAEFNRCLRSPSIARQVSQDVDAARRIGATGTPTMVVGNEVLGGALSLESIDAWIHRVQPRAFAK